MTTNLPEFVAEVRAFGRNVVPEALVAFHRKVALEALGRVVRKTPVDTGRARSGWQTTVGQEPDSEVGLPDPVASGAAVLGNLQPFETVYLSNNVPYIGFLENGSSQQAPNGMVAVTLQELRGIFG